MSGFKDESFNLKIADRILKKIITKVLLCSDLMVKDCTEKCKKLRNDEEDIRDYLFNQYLNNDTIAQKHGFNDFRFISEAPEHYIEDKPIGRTDLQVFSIDMFRFRKKYFTIECKRIDGTKKLNRFYLEKGVERFAGSNNPLYPSYFKRNCMFGFVVKSIDIDLNTKEINRLQNEEYTNINVESQIEHIILSPEYINTYKASYRLDSFTIELYHLFYDVSSVIR